MDKDELIQFLKDQNHDLNVECMKRGQLLHFYRIKRSCDGLNGRNWDAIRHLRAEKAIEQWEKKVQPINSAEACPIMDVHETFKEDGWGKCPLCEVSLR